MDPLRKPTNETQLTLTRCLEEQRQSESRGQPTLMPQRQVIFISAPLFVGSTFKTGLDLTSSHYRLATPNTDAATNLTRYQLKITAELDLLEAKGSTTLRPRYTIIRSALQNSKTKRTASGWSD